MGDIQLNRLLRLNFPRNDGPAAVLVPQRLIATEGLSRDFIFNVDLICENASIALKDVIGKLVTLALIRADGSQRYFNGYVFEFAQTGSDGGLARYHMQLRPWMAFLRLVRDQYLFHSLNVYDQTSQILRDYPSADWRAFDVDDDAVMTDACQFDETDYNYLHRRWAERGWTYYYEHRADGHQLVLCGDTRNNPQIDGDARVRFQAGGGSDSEDGIAAWAPTRRLVSSHYTATSFDFKNPRPASADQPTVNQQGDVPYLEIYDYAGALGFQPADSGDPYTRLRMERIETTAKTFRLSGNCRRLQPGRWFTLDDHFEDAGSAFLIEQVTHLVDNNFGNPDTPAEYRNRASVQRQTLRWRPQAEQNCQIPRVYGVQTATVVGPAGDEIHTDEYGRVRVQFHWDREGQYDQTSSAWVRVATTWAGANFGAVSIPRIGQEVIVQFLNGNPDRPLITGSVYNQANLPPWELPTNKTQSGVLSRSSLGGGYDNANAFRFEDKKGSEEVWLHAEKDQRIEVEHDETHWVGNDRSKTVDHDETVQIKNDRTETVDHNETITVHNDRTETVDNDERITIHHDRSERVDNNETISIGVDRNEDVGQNEGVTIGKDQQLKVGSNQTVLVGSNQSTQVGQSMSVQVGTTCSITVGDRLDIRVGAATLSLSSDGTIKLNGVDVGLTASGLMRIKGQTIQSN